MCIHEPKTAPGAIARRVRGFLLLPYLIFSLFFSVPAEAALETDAAGIDERQKVYSCAVHVHSEISSTGRYSLNELALLAEDRGIDVVFLTDNLTHRIQYGIAPARHLLWMDHSRRSIMSVGAEKYLELIEKQNRRVSNVLFIAGAEICPRFYWTGSLSKGDLTCRDHQRNIIVLGLDNPEVIESIPETAGFVRGRHTAWIIGSRVILGAFALAIAGVAVCPCLARRSGYSCKVLRRAVLRGFFVPIALCAVVFNVTASLVPAFDIYGAAGSPSHAQRTTDFLAEHGLLHYWAHPEEADRHRFRYAGVAFETRTDPYPEALRQTEGYTGFGGVYEGRNTLVEADGVWDRVLRDYVEGRRHRPAWCFGEMLYHYEGQAGKKLGNVETMVWASERSRDSILESMGRGRFYARRNKAERSLVLKKWQLRKKKQGQIEIDIRIESSGEPEQVSVCLVRNGEKFRELKGATPFDRTIADTSASEDVYYRLNAYGEWPLTLVANPIFTAGQ
ncbi:MAG: hypothetical protein R6V03_00670 [Kiritimatiellia bacterium]